MYSKQQIAELDEDIRKLEYRLSALKRSRNWYMKSHYDFQKRIASCLKRKNRVLTVKRRPLP